MCREAPACKDQGPAESQGSRNVSQWAELAKLGCMCLWTTEVKLESEPHGTPCGQRPQERNQDLSLKASEGEPGN